LPENRIQQRWPAHAARAAGLSRSGAGGALVIGLAALNSGPHWLGVLLVYFLAATVVSRYRAAMKVRRAGPFLEKAGPRDAAQVLANGGAFAAGLAAAALTGNPAWHVFAAGALAASSADTWATELGLLSSRPPRSVLSNKPVPHGSSGGVTLAGSVSGVAGAAVVAVAMIAFRTGPHPAAVLLAGVAGMVVDSLLGATLQERRRCPRCDSGSERRVHSCGAATVYSGGARGVNNDVVNALATVAGGGVALTASRVLW
jgi:uncharacterized protein (TIGR00297 family)